MSPGSRQDSPEAAFVVGRRSARLSIIIPITLLGMDNAGQAFRENTWTIGVNKQGAKIATFRTLPLGGQISVVNPVLGRSAKARVIWVGEKRFPEDPFEVGVELIEPQNVWGIKFPPEDWQKPLPPSTGTRGPEEAAEAATTQPIVRPTTPERPKPTEAPKGAEAPSTATKDAGAPPERFNQFNIAMQALSHFAQQAEVGAEARSETLPEPTAKLTPVIDSQTQAAVLQVGRFLEELQEKERNFRSLQQQIKAQADRLQASRDQVETLLTRLGEVQQGLEAEVERARAGIREASTIALQSTLEKAARQFMDRLAPFLNEGAQAALQSAERVFQEKLQRFQTQVRQETANAEAAAARLQEALKTDFPRKLADLSSHRLEEFRNKTQAPLADFQTLLQKTWREFQEKGTREILEQLQKNSDELLDLWAKELHRRGDEILGRLIEQLKAAEAQIVDATSRQLTASALAAREARTGEAEATAQTLRTLSEQLGASGKALVEETAREVGTLTRGALESLTREARAIAEECQGQARRTLEEFQDKVPRGLEANLQIVLERHREALQKRLQQEADDSTERALAQLRSKFEQVAKEASERVYKQVGAGSVVLKDWTDQARSLLEGFFQKALEAFQKQIADLSEATLEKHRRGSETMVEDLRTRLQQAAHLFQDKGTEAADAKSLEGAPGKQAEPASQQPSKRSKEGLDPEMERLKNKQEQAINEAAEAFRNKLSELFQGFQLGGKKADSDL